MSRRVPVAGETIMLLKNGFGEDIPPLSATVVDVLEVQFTVVYGDDQHTFLFYNDCDTTWS